MGIERYKKVFKYSKLISNLYFNNIEQIVNLSSLVSSKISFFKSPLISLEDKVDGLDSTSKDLITLFIRSGDIVLLEESVHRAIEIVNDLKGIKKFTLIVARDSDFKSASDMLFSNRDNKIIIKEVDPSIIGGFILKWNNRVIDSSIKNRLQKFNY